MPEFQSKTKRDSQEDILVAVQGNVGLMFGLAVKMFWNLTAALLRLAVLE